MDNQLTIFSYNEYDIAFDFTKDEVMVNATEMGKIFNVKPYQFLRNEETQKFISAMKSNKTLVQKHNDRYVKFTQRYDELPDEIVVKTQTGGDHQGTWMHRLLALKFAAYLNPEFEVWIYQTIDNLFKGLSERREEILKAKAKRLLRMDEIANQLGNNELFLEYRTIEMQLKSDSYQIGKVNNSQIDLFKTQLA